MVNVGKADVKFSWKVGAPFSISPETGSLVPGQEGTFNCTFMPDAASVFTGAAVCLVQGGPTIPLKLQGIGKYAFLVLDQRSADLGTVLLGRAAETTIKATNASTVPARFEVVSTSGGGGGVPSETQTARRDAAPLSMFRVTPAAGTIPPGQSLDLKVHFAPSFAGVQCSETFTVRATGGNRCEFDVHGVAQPPRITLSHAGLNFGSVAAGETVKRAVQIRNESAAELAYQIQCAPGVFSVEKPRGVLPPLGAATVTVAFRADAPSQYWRRAAVVLEGGEPLFLDLLASAYTAESHPPPPTESQARIAWGFGLQAAEALLTEAPAARLPSASHVASHASLAKFEQAVAEAPAIDPWECVFSQGAVGRAVSLDVTELDFGACSRLKPSEPKLLTITNRTQTRLSVFWQTQGQAPAAGVVPVAPKVFYVLPEKMDINAGARATFRVAFRPPKDGQLYAQSADLFVAPRRPPPPAGANPRAQPQYLPLHLSVPVQGHTLQQLVRFVFGGCAGTILSICT